MQKREKCDVRYMFSPNEKAEMLKRSGGICVHCGKKLSMNSRDLTAEHIIPISKGGKNTKDNLIILCEECNSDKANDIVWQGWYKYANDDLRSDISRLYSRYFKDFNHLDNNHFTQCDRYGINIDIDARTGDLVDDRLKQKPIRVKKGVEIKRAKESDFDKICSAYCKFNKMHGLEDDKVFVHNVVSAIMRHGCIWFCENNNGVQFVIPMIFMQYEFEDEVKKELYNSTKANVKAPELTLMYIICLSRKNLYYNCMFQMTLKIASELCRCLDINYLPMCVEGFNDGRIGGYMNHYYNSVRSLGDVYRSSILFNQGSYNGDTSDDIPDYAGVVKTLKHKLKEVGITPLSPKKLQMEIGV